jgi:anti-anti-sigma factor
VQEEAAYVLTYPTAFFILSTVKKKLLPTEEVMPLKISSREKRPTYFEITLEGRLDTDTSPQLEALLNQLFQNPVRGLQLNMRGVDYVSSAGIRVVLVAMKKIKAGGGTFMMTELQPPVKKVFDIARVLPSENVFTNIAEADAYFDAIQKKERNK